MRYYAVNSAVAKPELSPVTSRDPALSSHENRFLKAARKLPNFTGLHIHNVKHPANWSFNTLNDSSLKARNKSKTLSSK